MQVLRCEASRYVCWLAENYVTATHPLASFTGEAFVANSKSATVGRNTTRTIYTIYYERDSTELAHGGYRNRKVW